MPISEKTYDYNSILELVKSQKLSRSELANKLTISSACIYNWISALPKDKQQELKSVFVRKHNYNYESNKQTRAENRKQAQLKEKNFYGK